MCCHATSLTRAPRFVFKRTNLTSVFVFLCLMLLYATLASVASVNAQKRVAAVLQPKTPPTTVSQSPLPPVATKNPTVKAASTLISPARPTTPTTSSLFVGGMRPEGNAVSSGSGVSTLKLSSDERTATIRFNYSNLSAPMIAAHIHGPANPGENAGIIFDFDTAPRQADGSYIWQIGPIGTLSAADIVAAIKSGRTYINVHTSRYPAGEIRAHYRQVNGSTVFTPPPPVPPITGGPASAQDAARFLTQATFGVKPDELQRLQQIGFEAYLNEQFNAPIGSHTARMRATGGSYVNSFMESFWYKAIKSDDQLRQRVAFALSQIHVISTYNSAIGIQEYAFAGHLDVLQNDAFGNFRDLLRDVTLNPAMGMYLSMFKNDKEDPATGRVPNENYAREINQLFSIGLYKLHPDGSLILDENGEPIATYDQSVIVGFAHVFTGWSWGGVPTDDGGWYYPSTTNANWSIPMQAWENHHSKLSKKLLNGVTLPANQTAQEDLDDAVDNIFNHPNVAPFISRQLIQRLVTSNPSPGYVYRVASVFNNNGAGVRGDMKAVIKAILLDYEARSPEVFTQPGYGKQREPVLRLSSLLRLTNAIGIDGQMNIWNLEDPAGSLGQNPYRAPSVFNFYEPNYSHPGNVAAAGLYSPEFQITTDTQIIGSTNQLGGIIRGGGFGGGQWRINLDYSALQLLAGNPDQLIDHLNLVLMNGQMPAVMRSLIVARVREIPDNQPRNRVTNSLNLIINSQQFAIQK